MKTITPPFIKHRDHPVKIVATDKQNGAYYHCDRCRKFVGWLSKLEVERARELGLVKNH